MKNSFDMRATYAVALRHHAHELISEGYHRMDFWRYTDWEEPAITGELVRAMRSVLESEDSPDWAVYYSIADDPPLNVPGRVGKSRPRVDIEFERSGIRGCRPRLRFEAKRLGKTPGHTVSVYLGKDGMGCFLSGKYPLTHDEAGMIGYVQAGDEADWSDQIKTALVESSERYAVVSPSYRKQEICSMEHTYRSHHRAWSSSSVIAIHHMLLRFHP